MTKKPFTRCQQAALLFAGVSCSILAVGSWSLEASAHPHAPGTLTIPHTHEDEDTSPHWSAAPALWFAGLSCAIAAAPVARRLWS